VLADEDDLSGSAFRQGRQMVVELVGRAVSEARQRVAALASTLSPQAAEVLRHRLEEVERRLDSLTPVTGSSSSTTTS
jgi:hypothetical protein